MKDKEPRPKLDPRVKIEVSLRPKDKARMQAVADAEGKLLSRWAHDVLHVELKWAEKAARAGNPDRAQVQSLGAKP